MSQNDSRNGKRLAKTGKAPPGGGKAPAAKGGFFGNPFFRSKLFLAMTIAAGIIVVGFAAWNLFSAAPEVDNPDRPELSPQVTTLVDEHGNMTQVPVQQGPSTPSEQKKQFYTFLLAGQSQETGGSLTDTMMLAAYDVPNQKLSVMNLPRDIYVDYAGRTRLLNSVYVVGGGDKDGKGIEALKQEVQKLTGIYPNYDVTIQWEALGALVDAIGGVDFDVPRRMYYKDLSQHFVIDLQKGMQHLDGDKAMQLIRWRQNSDANGNPLNSGYATGDLGRITTQQDFLKAVIKKCLDPGVLLPNLTQFIDIFQKNVVTNLTASNLAYFGKTAVGGLKMENVEFFTLPYQSAGNGHLLPVKSEILELVNEHFNPYIEPLTAGELSVVGKAQVAINQGGSAASNASVGGSVSSTPKPTPSPTPSPAGEPEPSSSVDPLAPPVIHEPLPPGGGDNPTDPTPAVPSGPAAETPRIEPPESEPPAQTPEQSAPPPAETPAIQTQPPAVQTEPPAAIPAPEDPLLPPGI